MKASKDWKNVLRYLAFAIAFLLAGLLLIFGGKRLWAKSHMEAGQLFCLSEREVRSISLTDRRTGERTAFHDPDTVAFVVQTLNDYRYSYVFRFDRERADPNGGFLLSISRSGKSDSYLFAGDGFLVNDLWYGGDTAALSNLAGLLEQE